MLREIRAGPRDERWIGPYEVAKMQSEGVGLVRDFRGNVLGTGHPAIKEQPEDEVSEIIGHKKRKRRHGSLRAT